jgi:hypothetical protein
MLPQAYRKRFQAVRTSGHNVAEAQRFSFGIYRLAGRFSNSSNVWSKPTLPEVNASSNAT